MSSLLNTAFCLAILIPFIGSLIHVVPDHGLLHAEAFILAFLYKFPPFFILYAAAVISRTRWFQICCAVVAVLLGLYFSVLIFAGVGHLIVFFGNVGWILSGVAMLAMLAIRLRARS